MVPWLATFPTSGQNSPVEDVMYKPVLESRHHMDHLSCAKPEFDLVTQDLDISDHSSKLCLQRFWYPIEKRLFN